jgi:hypothetical protein
LIPKIQHPICPPANCSPGCDIVFARVHVSYLTAAGAKICWTLSQNFSDPDPWIFQVQQSMSGGKESGDWQDVEKPVKNKCLIALKEGYPPHGEKTYYRVKLKTPKNTYFSDPVSRGGILSQRDWRMAREIMRRESVHFKYNGSDGYLLKRRWGGQDCPRCLEPQTDMSLEPDCPVCYGTGKMCGYYSPIDCFRLRLDTAPVSSKMSENSVEGVVKDVIKSGTAILVPSVETLDVWVNKYTDDRYVVVGQASPSVAVRDVPIIGKITLKLLPDDHAVYGIPIQNQIDDFLA